MPGEALDWIRKNWGEAEPVLLAEVDSRLKDPGGKDPDARFLYAIHLCAEMRCPKAFPRYLAICRLPNVIQEHVMGDILTESIPEMLARTCAGRVDELQSLIEDSTVNEYARAGALNALHNLMLDGVVTREWLSTSKRPGRFV